LIPCLALLSGCQIFAPFYVAAMMMGYDTRIDPPFHFPEDAKRVVVITYCDSDTLIEMGHIDHELNELVSRMLAKGFDEGKDQDPLIRLTSKKTPPEVILSSKVARWQDEHEDWRSLTPAEMGRELKADYVIYVEVGGVRIYENGSSKILYRGQAEVTVSVHRVEDELVAMAPEIISIQYPRERSIPVSPDIPPLKFRRQFLRIMAERISWFFLPHESGDEFMRDPV
jgi:hypothetical protein